MSLLYADAADHYSYLKLRDTSEWKRWAHTDWNGGMHNGRYWQPWSFGQPRVPDFRDQSLFQMNTGLYGAGTYTRTLTATSGELILGFDFQLWNNLGPDYIASSFIRLDNAAGTSLIHLATDEDMGEVGEDKLLEIWKGGDGTSYDGSLVSTGATAIEADTWYYGELRIALPNTVEFKLNGSSEISGNPSLSDSMKKLNLRWQHWGQQGIDIDNIYLVDTNGSYNNGYLGPCRLITLTPVVGTGPNEWVIKNFSGTSRPSTQAAMINEVRDTFGASDYPDNDTTYLEGKTAGQTSFVSIDNPWLYTGYRGVVITYSLKGVGASGQTFKPVLRKGAVEYQLPSMVTYDGVTHTVPFQPRDYWEAYTCVLEKSPFTGSPWTYDDLVTLELGGRMAGAGSGEIRWTQVVAELLVSISAAQAGSRFRGRWNE